MLECQLDVSISNALRFDLKTTKLSQDKLDVHICSDHQPSGERLYVNIDWRQETTLKLEP